MRVVVIAALTLASGMLARASTLFQDNFSTPGIRLDLANWTTEIGQSSFLGRTQLADWVTPGGVGQFVVGPGGAQLALNTFNPTGFSLYGTHGKTRMSFQPTASTAIILNARIRLTSLQPGLVYGVYFYGCPGPCATQHDEIDIELVGNLLQPGGSPLMVQLNRYANEPLGAGSGELVNLPTGFNALVPHDWTIRWSLARIDYFVDGVLLSTATTHVPQGPMQVNVIAWGPAPDWAAAFSSSLQPVGSAAQNQSFIALLSSVIVISSPTVPEPPPDAYQVRYAANPTFGDSVVSFTNAGALNGLDPAGRICLNVYTFDRFEEMISCCACQVTPNGLSSVSARNDLLGRTLTPGEPSSMVIKLLASTLPAGGVCDASTPTAATLAPGLRAWGTTLHPLPTHPVTYGSVETPFAQAELSASELQKLTSYCGFIQAAGSGFGLCRSCQTGGLGAVAKE